VVRRRPALAPTDDQRPLPQTFLRGLRSSKWADGNDVLAEAFVPEPASSTGRQDGDGEASINWEDDTDAVAFTLADPNGKYGAARLPTEVIATASRIVIAQDHLKGERKRTPRNPYHGNLVFVTGMSRRVQKAIANCLAVNARRVSPEAPSTTKVDPAPKRA